MELPIDQIFELAGKANSGLVQSILLVLIWLNVRSLKSAMIKLEDGHSKRLTSLELDMEKVKGQLTVRHT